MDSWHGVLEGMSRCVLPSGRVIRNQVERREEQNPCGNHRSYGRRRARLLCIFVYSSEPLSAQTLVEIDKIKLASVSFLSQNIPPAITRSEVNPRSLPIDSFAHQNVMSASCVFPVELHSENRTLNKTDIVSNLM